MPTKRPEFQPGLFYHFYNRGCSRLSIFKNEGDYQFVLRKMKEYSRELNLSVLAYCLMPNHYHFLIRQDTEKPAGLFPQRVFNSYSKVYNYLTERSGTLFEGPYRVKLVSDDSYLLHICRYIHANPVKDGLVAAPQDWPYSNYLEWIGQRDGTLIDREFLKETFSQLQEYAAFVQEYLQSLHMPTIVAKHLESLLAG